MASLINIPWIATKLSYAKLICPPYWAFLSLALLSSTCFYFFPNVDIKYSDSIPVIKYTLWQSYQWLLPHLSLAFANPIRYLSHSNYQIYRIVHKGADRVDCEISMIGIGHSSDRIGRNNWVECKRSNLMAGLLSEHLMWHFRKKWKWQGLYDDIGHHFGFDYIYDSDYL